MMHSLSVIFACTVIFLNVNLVCSLEFHKNFEKPTELPSDASWIKLELDALFELLKNPESSNYMKDLMKEADRGFVWKSPGKFDYFYLAYDVVAPTAKYFGYWPWDEDKISDKELCEQLIGAGMAFGGSIAGTSVGSFGGTMIYPGWGTLIGGWLGGYVGYYAGGRLGREVVGDFVCPFIVQNNEMTHAIVIYN